MKYRWFAAATAVLTLASAWSCGGGGGGSSSPTTPTPVTSGPPTITITSNAGARSFSPNPATLGGQMVIFRNTSTEVHRVRLNDGSLDTGDIAPGASSQALLMPTAGTNYHCSLHPTMIGAVSPPNAPPPPCTGEYC
jgi:plastocyanin